MRSESGSGGPAAHPPRFDAAGPPMSDRPLDACASGAFQHPSPAARGRKPIRASADGVFLDDLDPTHLEHPPAGTLEQSQPDPVAAVGSSLGAAREIIRPGENGFLLTPEDSAGLAKVVEDLYADRNRLDAMSRRALATFRMHPGWQDTMEKIHVFLNTLAE